MKRGKNPLQQLKMCPKYSAVQYEQRGGDKWDNKNGPLANLGQDGKKRYQ